MKVSWFVCFLMIFVSCSSGTKIKRQNVTFLSVEIPDKWELDTVSRGSLIDSHVGRIVTEDQDTIKYEYGPFVYTLYESSRTVVPESQKQYWDSVGLASEVVLSKTPKEDIERCVYTSQYYVKDTIDNKDLIWVFPKKFNKGKSGAYFNDVNGVKFSIYMDSLGNNEDDFISLVKSIRFLNKES